MIHLYFQIHLLFYNILFLQSFLFLFLLGMPKALKEQVADRLNATAKELYGIDNFTDMIGDETIAEDPETLLEFLTEKGHPALGMDPMM